jgi:hypothetical protein
LITLPAWHLDESPEKDDEMKMEILFAVILLSLGVLSNVSAAQSSDPSLDSYIEPLRADLRADKVAIITEAMQFNDQDSKALWPVYRKYETAVTKVNDQRLALIKSYSRQNRFDGRTPSQSNRRWTAQSLSSCAVEICDRVRRSHECVPMRPAGS